MADVAKSIQETAAEQIAALGPRLESAVVDKLVDVELTKRMIPLVQGLENLKKLDLEIKKTDKEHHIFTLADGEKVMGKKPETLEAVKKLTDKREKLVKSIQKAFDHGDLADLNQLNQSFGKGDKSDGKDKAASESEGSGETS